MRALGLIILSLFLVIGVSHTTYAQKKGKKASVTIKTSIACAGCKANVEKALLKQKKKIVKAEVNLSNRTITVVYKTKKLSENDVRQMIADMGYDADGIKANPSKVPSCCKPK